MKQSFLSNDRIYLRAVEPEDMDVMYEMENDPSMWDISNFTVPYSRYVLRQYIEGSQCDVFADKQLRLMIMSKSHFPKRKNKPGTLYYREASGRISQPRNRILPRRSRRCAGNPDQPRSGQKVLPASVRNGDIR